MSNDNKLPPLPKPDAIGVWGYMEPTTYSAEAMRAYALSALAATSEKPAAAAERGAVWVNLLRVENAARSVVYEYEQRFTVPGRGLVGPIDEAVRPLRDAVDDYQRDIRATPPAQAAEPAQVDEATHPDDSAVDAFAESMKEKLAAARKKGRDGWQTCQPSELSRMLREHVEKGDPRDVANFCMFLWHLGYGIFPGPLSSRDQRIRAAMERMDRDGPLPGMIAAFEQQFGQTWTDRDWRQEASIWSAAWRAALTQRPAASVVVPEGFTTYKPAPGNVVTGYPEGVNHDTVVDVVMKDGRRLAAAADCILWGSGVQHSEDGVLAWRAPGETPIRGFTLKQAQALAARPAAPLATDAGVLSMTDEMRSFIEGMSVSVDVSTGDSDFTHRYMGTVTEVMNDPHDKHGVTLLVQDAEPNFCATKPKPIGWVLRFNDPDPQIDVEFTEQCPAGWVGRATQIYDGPIVAAHPAAERPAQGKVREIRFADIDDRFLVLQCAKVMDAKQRLQLAFRDCQGVDDAKAALREAIERLQVLARAPEGGRNDTEQA